MAAAPAVLAASLEIRPNQVAQGDPVLVTILGANSLPVKSAPNLHFFFYNGQPTAFYGTDLNQKSGTTTLAVTLADGSQLTGAFFLAPRPRPVEVLPIPVQLGGNSPANQAAVVSQLAKENSAINTAYSRLDKALWTKPFLYPLKTAITITDPYGYSRDSGEHVIAHKGADFRAPLGTPVYAINRGVVRAATTYTVYGKTVIVDHGLGLLSIYMHLSKLSVAPGQLVERSQLIGYSGATGYAEGAHLHLTIRINGVSIDPLKFFNLLGQ